MTYYICVLIKFCIGFLIVIGYMNLSGKTQLSQMTPVDFIGNFVLGGIIGGIIYNEQISFRQYIIVLILGIALIYALNFVTRKFSLFRAMAIGNPIPIIKNGKFLMNNIRSKSNKIDILGVASLLRAQGILSFDKINYAQIEPGGQITVVCDEDSIPAVILVKDGSIISYGLGEIDKDERWLREKIRAAGVKNIQDIFFAEYLNDEIKFILNNGDIKKVKLSK